LRKSGTKVTDGIYLAVIEYPQLLLGGDWSKKESGGRMKMSIYFAGGELIKIALDIEESGAAFYQALADKTRNKEAQVIYDYLTNQEKKHINLFQDMLDVIGQYQPAEDYAEEYMLYLKSLVDSSVFSDITEAKQKAERVADETEALDTGVQAEKDSILFYTEMKNFVRPSEQNVILDIINEEREHLRQLSHLKQIIREQ